MILVVCAGLALAACSKEQPMMEPTAPATKMMAMSVAVENGMLKFANEAAIDSTLSMLLQKDEAGLAAWYDSVGFVSQEMAREAALEEFRAMRSLEEYPVFKAKYVGQFLFNDNLAEEDYQPYVAANRFAYEMILNADGNAIVGGRVVNYNYDRFEQTMYYRAAHEQPTTKISAETKLNQVYVISGKKKFWAWAVRNGTEVYIQVTAQKKNMFGWNDYKADYSFRISSHIVSVENGMGPGSQLNFSGTYFGNTLNKITLTGRVSCNSRFLMVKTFETTPVKARFVVWSSGTGEGNSGVLDIQI